MEELDNILSIALDRYFELLKCQGACSYSNVNNLLCLQAIQYIVSNYTEHITDCDYALFNRLLYEISGNCLIDYPVSLSTDNLTHPLIGPVEVRYTEIYDPRMSQSNYIRIKN